MAAASYPNERLFLDASFAIALSIANDAHHRPALELLRQLQNANATTITTRPVLLEIGNGLSRQRHRTAA